MSQQYVVLQEVHSDNEDEGDMNNTSDPKQPASLTDGKARAVDSSIKNPPRKFKYILEPLIFVQESAKNIVNACLNQFIYKRFLNRLLKSTEHPVNHYSNGYFDTYDAFHMTITSSFGEIASKSTNCPGTSNSTNSSGLFHPADSSELFFLTDDAANKAQEMTSSLNFTCSLFSSISLVLMTMLFSINCSRLGRKTLIVNYVFMNTLRYSLIFCQCLFPDWPDWVFYVSSFLDGLSSSMVTFHMAVYCYLADVVQVEERSFRMAFISVIGFVANLSVTLVCGYVIKYWGFLYLFLTSAILSTTSLTYSVLVIPESLAELAGKSYWQRIKTCSFKHYLNCIKVYFTSYTSVPQDDPDGDKEDNHKDGEYNLVDEAAPLLPKASVTVKKQSHVLILIVFANEIFKFISTGTSTTAGVFQLFIINNPFCFDSVDISYFNAYTTILSIVACFVVARFVRLPDLAICIMAVSSQMFAFLFFIFGKTTVFIYIGSAVSSIYILQFGYVQSIISKSMHKSEISDALALFAILDALLGTYSTTVCSKIYQLTVAESPNFIFVVFGCLLVVPLVSHIISLCLYKPLSEDFLKTCVVNKFSFIKKVNPDQHSAEPVFDEYLRNS